MVDPGQISDYIGSLFRHVDWGKRVISLLGIGEKGTDKEGVFRERKFINFGTADAALGHATRWAAHNSATFIVPCVIEANAVIVGDVKLAQIAEMVGLIADFDDGDVDAKVQFATDRLGQPSMVVQSGGKTSTGHDKKHLYWIFNEPCDEVDRVAAIRKLLAQKCGGDPSFGRATQVIRLPGSVHAKNDNPTLCRLIESNDADYSFDDLAAIIEEMAPMDGIVLETPLALALPTGGMDFSAGAGRGSGTVTDTMMKDVHEGGLEVTRWDSFNQVAGFNIQQYRLGSMSMEEAAAATKGWMLSHMVPIWPDARFNTEFNALINKDRQTNGPPVTEVVQAQAVQAVEQAAGIKATPFGWIDPSTIPPRPWVMGRWLLRNTVSAVVAPGGVGKSAFMASCSLSLASGKKTMGMDIWGRPQRVWLWNLEDDGDELSRSFHAAAIQHRLTRDDIGSRLFVDSGPDGAGLCTATEDRSGFVLRRPITEAVQRELLERKIDVLIVDPFVSSHEIDENANAKIDAVVKEWARVAKAAHCSIVLVHHSKKLDGRKVTGESSRGASSLINAARSVLVLNRMEIDEGAMFGIEQTDCGRYFNVQDDKHNRSPVEAAQWFHLQSVQLANGDNVGVTIPWKPPSIMEGVTPEHLSAIQMVVKSGGVHRASDQTSEWVGNVVARITNIDITEPMGKRKVRKILDQWIKLGYFQKFNLPIKVGKNTVVVPCIRVASEPPKLTVVPKDDDE